MPLSRIFYSLLIPLIIFSAGLWLIYNDDILPEIVIPILVYLPFASALILLLISYQFNLFRLFTLPCMMILWYYLTDFQPIDSQILTTNQQDWLIWLIPIVLMLLSWLPERGIFTLYGLLGWLSLGGLIWVSYFALGSDLYRQLITDNLPWNGGSALFIVTIIALSCVHQLIRIWHKDRVLDGVLLFIMLIIGWYYLFAPEKQLGVIILHNLIQILIIWGLIKHSHDMAYRDELTGLPGRRALNEWLKAPGRKYVIAMLDIDHFKKFNDRHGHDVGDDVLKVVASRLARVAGGGRAYRYGGEEFTIIFPGKEVHECTPYLEAVREDIAHYKISLREKQQRPKSSSQGRKKRGAGTKGKKISVTISVGVASKTADRNAEQVIKAADNVLYKAKKAGRNCLVADKSS